MHRFGGYQAGKTFLVDRISLLGQLKALEGGGDFKQERRRRLRLSEELKQASVAFAARTVSILAAHENATDLPSNIQLRPGELRITFQGADDLLQQLLTLAMSVQQDLDRFRAICEDDSGMPL